MIWLAMILSFTVDYWLYPASRWLNNYFQLDLWFCYYFRPKALKRDEHYLWEINNYNSEAPIYNSMEKKTLRAKIYLAALKALNEVNDYNP